MVGFLLRWGTLLAGMWILAGSLLFLLGEYAPTTATYSSPKLGSRLLADEGVFFIRPGMMILLLTPVLSTLLIGLSSLRRRDWPVVGATLIIIGVLWLNSPFR